MGVVWIFRIVIDAVYRRVGLGVLKLQPGDK